MKPRYGLLAVFLLVAVNVFAIKVTYDYDRAVNFANYKTYQWVDLKDNKISSLTDGKIKQAIDEELAKKGFTKVDSNPSFYISYQVGVQNEQQVNMMTTGGWGYSPWWGPGMYGGGMGTTTATTSTIRIGTLIVSFIDPGTKKLFFRSQGTDTLNPSSDPDKNYKKIQKAVAKILQNFPPKPKS